MAFYQLKEGLIHDEIVTANAASQSFDGSFKGSFLYQIELLASLDTTVQFIILSDLGATLYDSTSGDWTSATGDITLKFPLDYYFLAGNPVWTVAGLGSGNLRFRVTCTRNSPES